MQTSGGTNRSAHSGSVEGDESGPERRSRIGELFGKTKPNAAGSSSENRNGPIDPRAAWGPEPAGPVAPKKRGRKSNAERAAQAAEAAGEETLLSVKAPPPPPPPAPKPKAEDVEGWAGLLYLGHAVAANLIKIPELALDPQASKELSVASMNVMRHYSNTILSEKTQDWIKLAMVSSQVYLPRLAAAGARKRAEKAAKGATPPPGMNAAGGFDNPSPGNMADCSTASGAEAFDAPQTHEEPEAAAL